MAETQFWVGVHGVIEDAGKILVLRRAAPSLGAQTSSPVYSDGVSSEAPDAASSEGWRSV